MWAPWRKRVEGAVDVEYYEAASKARPPAVHGCGKPAGPALQARRLRGGTRMTFYADMARHRDGDADGVRENRRPDAPVVQFRSGDEQACFRRHEQPDDGRPVHAHRPRPADGTRIQSSERVMVIDGSVAPLGGRPAGRPATRNRKTSEPRPEPFLSEGQAVAWTITKIREINRPVRRSVTSCR